MRWVKLLKRVVDLDLEHCPNCGGGTRNANSPATRINEPLRNVQ